MALNLGTCMGRSLNVGRLGMGRALNSRAMTTQKTIQAGMTDPRVKRFFQERVSAATVDDKRITGALGGELIQSVGPIHHAAFRSIEPVYPLDQMVEELKAVGYQALRRLPLGKLNTVELKHEHEFEVDGSGNPYLFVSSIEPNQLPKEGRKILEEMVPKLSEDGVKDWVASQRHEQEVALPMTREDYKELKASHQYAAWTVTNVWLHQMQLLKTGRPLSGFALNHFAYDTTQRFRSVEQFKKLADILEKNGLGINQENGRFQEDHGEEAGYYFGQFSTISSARQVTFHSEPESIPGSYVEFTRIIKPESEPFLGFRQAHGLFSSTNLVHGQKKN